MSRCCLQLLDVEMWRYAREMKRETAWPGMVEEHRTNVEATLMGTRLRTDARGFRREDPEAELVRKNGNQVVFCVGDSVTLGWGTAEGQTYPARLEKLLNQHVAGRAERPFTVYNAGIGNSNTSMQLARYKRDLRPLHPSWVILGFFINDAEPDPVPNHNPLLRMSALLSLFAGQWTVHTEAGYKNYQTYYEGLYKSGNPGWIRMQTALREFGQILRQDAVSATLLLIPEMHAPHQFGRFAGIYSHVTSLAVECGFEVIDPSDEFEPGPGTVYWVSPTDAHPNARAQSIFASALMRSRFIR